MKYPCRPRATLAVALQESPAPPQGEVLRPYVDRAGASPAPTLTGRGQAPPLHFVNYSVVAGRGCVSFSGAARYPFCGSSIF